MASQNSSITPAASSGISGPNPFSLNTGIDLVGGAVTDLFGAKAAKTSAAGDRLEATSYRQAAGMANDNATFAQTSADVADFQQARTNFQATGQTEAEVGGAGFSNSGSSLDILRDSAREGSLARSMITQQGSINVESYHEQASALNTQAQAADMAAQAQEQQAKTAKKSGIIKGILGAVEIAGSIALAPATGGLSLAGIGAGLSSMSGG